MNRRFRSEPGKWFIRECGFPWHAIVRWPRFLAEFTENNKGREWLRADDSMVPRRLEIKNRWLNYTERHIKFALGYEFRPCDLSICKLEPDEIERVIGNIYSFTDRIY